MNIFGNLSGGQIFCATILGFMLLLVLESLRRELREKPWPKVAFRLICLIISCRIVFYGLSEIQSGRWTGAIWMLIGTGFNYIVIRGLWQAEVWQKRVRGLKLFTRTGRLMYLLGLVLLALLIGITLMLSGRSDFPR